MMSHNLKKRSCVNREFKSPLISRTSEQRHSAGDMNTSSSPHCPQPSGSQVSVQGVRGGQSSSQRVDNNDDDEKKRLQKDVEKLREELRETENQIQQLRDSGIEESELCDYINKLHEYNDLKDMGQMVIGNIASLQGVRTRDLYPKYGLELDD